MKFYAENVYDTQLLQITIHVRLFDAGTMKTAVTFSLNLLTLIRCRLFLLGILQRVLFFPGVSVACRLWTSVWNSAEIDSTDCKENKV